jgi:Na+/H+ antiporter
MHAFEHALILLLLVSGLSLLTRWLSWWPPLITYLLGGVGMALIPAFPRMTLDPGFFFLCFLPPLLFSDGWLIPLREFARAKRPIILLAIGLVTFTTLTVGLVAHWLIPGIPLAMAFALGAIVSPTDAVAINSITERLKVPARLSTILDGESLMNDATGLVAFKFALAAVIAGTFSFSSMLAQFSWFAIGGLGIGLGVGYLISRVRDLLMRLHVSDPLIEITLSLITPYAAYLAAEVPGVSGILAVVAAGLYCGWRDPVQMDAETRQSTYAVWNLVVFWLNGIAFVLLGLQFPRLITAVSSHYNTAQLVVYPLLISVVAILARMIWVYPATYLPRFLKSVRTSEGRPSRAGVFVVGWAGMRGTVTLAGALSIPLLLPDGSPFPYRDIVIYLAAGVIAVTLLLQGTTLEWLIHRLGIREDSERPKEDLLARITAVTAGLKTLKAMDKSATTIEMKESLAVVIEEYERRLASLGAQGEPRTRARRRRDASFHYRAAALHAERHAIDDLWRSGKIIDDVHRPLQQLLDHEETLLSRSAVAPVAEDGATG